MDNRRVSSRSRSRSLSRPSARHATATLQRLAAVGIHPMATRGMAPSSRPQGGAPASPVGKDEGKGKGKDLPNERYLECDFCKKECTGAWNESYTIWRRTCCLGMSRAPSGSSSVEATEVALEWVEAAELAQDPPPPTRIPASIMKTVRDIRILNPHARDVRPVPYEFGVDGWAVAGPGGFLVLPTKNEQAAWQASLPAAAATAAPLP